MVKAIRPDIPDGELFLSYITVPAQTVLHRIHLRQFGPTQFNPIDTGNARFSPIKDSAGHIIPTLYAGTTFHCAAMETLFHEVPYAPGFKTYQRSLMAGNVHSRIVVGNDLTLVDLSSKALRQLGIERSYLIDTASGDYPYTRQWAEAIHAFAPHAQGLRWVSRQDDTAIAIVLFGDRIGPNDIALHSPGRDVFQDPATIDELVTLASLIGVLLLDT